MGILIEENHPAAIGSKRDRLDRRTLLGELGEFLGGLFWDISAEVTAPVGKDRPLCARRGPQRKASCGTQSNDEHGSRRSAYTVVHRNSSRSQDLGPGPAGLRSSRGDPNAARVPCCQNTIRPRRSKTAYRRSRAACSRTTLRKYCLARMSNRSSLAPGCVRSWPFLMTPM